MADVVGPNLHLEPFLRGCWGVTHCSRIQHQDIQTIAVRVELFCGRADGFERGQVERDVSNIHRGGETLLNRRDSILSFGRVPCA